MIPGSKREVLKSVLLLSSRHCSHRGDSEQALKGEMRLLWTLTRRTPLEWRTVLRVGRNWFIIQVFYTTEKTTLLPQFFYQQISNKAANYPSLAWFKLEPKRVKRGVISCYAAVTALVPRKALGIPKSRWTGKCHKTPQLWFQDPQRPGEGWSISGGTALLSMPDLPWGTGRQRALGHGSRQCKLPPNPTPKKIFGIYLMLVGCVLTTLQFWW